jgi:hypothetical protein
MPYQLLTAFLSAGTTVIVFWIGTRVSDIRLRREEQKREAAATLERAISLRRDVYNTFSNALSNASTSLMRILNPDDLEAKQGRAIQTLGHAFSSLALVGSEPVLSAALRCQTLILEDFIRFRLIRSKLEELIGKSHQLEQPPSPLSESEAGKESSFKRIQNLLDAMEILVREMRGAVHQSKERVDPFVDVMVALRRDLDQEIERERLAMLYRSFAMDGQRLVEVIVSTVLDRITETIKRSNPESKV